MSTDHLFVGQIVHTKSLGEFEIFTNGFLAVKAGKIIKIGHHSELNAWKVKNNVNLPLTKLTKTQFLLPGFVDCHIHAPQLPNIGLGLDKPLLKWLESYTFPLESQYKDEEFAKHVYEKVIKRTLSSGTTLASYFGANYRESNIILAHEAKKQGQRAFIGKTSSDCNCPDYYLETTNGSLADNVQCIEAILALNEPLVQPVVTPRFAISCTPELMMGLADIAKKYNLRVQTHVSENIDEVKVVEEMFKKNYCNAYDDTGILTDKCILAHGVFLKDDELKLLSERGTSVAHCPASNVNLCSGICDVRRILNANVNIGLGTDVSGGNQASILSLVRSALDVSHCLEFAYRQSPAGGADGKKYVPLNYKEVLYLATLGGAKALGQDGIVGNFVEGKEFDGLLVDIDGGQVDVFNFPESYTRDHSDERKLLDLVEKFVYVGDDRNVKEVYVRGRQVKV